jgi:hypothetical protein
LFRLKLTRREGISDVAFQTFKMKRKSTRSVKSLIYRFQKLNPTHSHWQDGRLLTVLHSALIPQALIQGSRHFSRMHARLLGQSRSLVHSGRQLGGLPVYPVWQEQAYCSFRVTHSL